MIKFNLQLFGGRGSGGGKGGGGSGGQVNRTSTHDGGEYEKEFVKQQTTGRDTWYYHGNKDLGEVIHTFSGDYLWSTPGGMLGSIGGNVSTLKEAMERIVTEREKRTYKSRF